MKPPRGAFRKPRPRAPAPIPVPLPVNTGLTHGRVHTCRPGSEPSLLRELGTVFPGSTHVWLAPGAVLSTLGAEDEQQRPCLAFNQQCLPHARQLNAASIKAWADLLAQQVMEQLAEHHGPWRLHLWAHDVPGALVKAGRIQLIQQGLVDVLSRRQKRLLRTRLEDHAPWAADEHTLQAFFVAPDVAWWSAVSAPQRGVLERVMVHAPGGVFVIPDDARPPSRAFKKLQEALLHADASFLPHQTVVDLGACPGGWSWVALQAGARVVAVDRSPLDAALMAHPRLQFVKADAFSHRPPERVDWLVCDVIAFPQRTLELVQQWVGERLCKAFCVTFKFRGDEHHAVVESAKALMEKNCRAFFIRQLQNNKNECTAVGFLRE